MRPDLNPGDLVMVRGEPGTVQNVWHSPIHGYLVVVHLDRLPGVDRLVSPELVETVEIIFEPDFEW